MSSFPLMLFAAGFGTRMGALTRACPKPLIAVAGRTLLDRALDLGREAGCEPVVVNTHYLADQIAAHLAGSQVRISHEPEILETGGGLQQARPYLGAGPVMTLNPDVVWTGGNPLTALASGWDPAKMGALLLLGPRAGLAGRKGGADFTLGADGRIARMRRAAAGGPDLDPDGMVYLGAQIIGPGWRAPEAERAFSLNRVWDALIAEGLLYGLVWQGGWCDVGSPEGLAEAEALLAR